MGDERVYDPVLEINNKPVLVVPNSIKTDDGQGETKVENMSYGGGSFATVTSKDVSTLVGIVKFEMPFTIDNLKAVKGWQRNTGKNTVVATYSAGGKTETEYYQQMSVTNKIEKETGVDGKFSVEMGGAAAE